MTLKDLYLGGVITVYSRQLTIERYADKALADVRACAEATVGLLCRQVVGRHDEARACAALPPTRSGGVRA